MQTLLFFLLAALGEISGCYCFWVWSRLGKSIFWTLPGILALIIFAYALTKISASNAGRIYFDIDISMKKNQISKYKQRVLPNILVV